MKGIVLAEMGHIVNALPPIDANGGKNSDVWSMRDHAHATILVQVGVSGGAVPTLKVQACDDFTPSNTSDMAFSYWAETTSDGDTLATKASATASGVALNTNNNIFYVIEVDASELPAGFPNMRVNLSDSAASTIMAVSVILTGARNSGDPANRRSAVA